MVSRYLHLCFTLALGLLLLVSGSLQASELSASVDRNRLNDNESLTLYLTSPGLQLSTEPDLSGLYQDFEVLAQQVRTNIRIINGENRSERIWEISLLPKRTGTLIIPAIPFGDISSQPITLEVQAAPANTQASADVFLHSEINRKDSIYVQEQLIYTLRLYYATSISDHGLTDPELDNVLMVQLGNRKDFEARIDGRLYNVAEWQFALYPQSSGELVIPPQTFSGRVRIQNRYSLGGLKHIRIQSPEHRIEVKPVPDSFPANAQWLPARSVRLSQQWSGDFSQWQAGQSLTRTLQLQAEGLTAAQLPPLLMPSDEHLRLYPEQPRQEDLPVNLNSSGASLTGQKQVSIALIPTRAGNLQLEPIRIPWWNTETDQLEYAELDGLNLDIQADPDQPAKAETAPAAQPESLPATAQQPDNRVRIWQLVSVLLMMISAALAAWLWSLQRRFKSLQQQLQYHRQHTAPGTKPGTKPGTEENPIFRQALLNACRQNQARAAWDAWQKWQRAENPQTTPEFAQALTELQQTLFGPEAAPEQWQGQALADASTGVQQPPAKAAPVLPQLYPSAS